MGAQEGPSGEMEDLGSKDVGWQPGLSPTTFTCPKGGEEDTGGICEQSTSTAFSHSILSSEVSSTWVQILTPLLTSR